MREKIKDKGRLEHILNSIDVLLCNKGKYEYADVEKEPIVFFGFVKHVEIIGEAVYMLTTEFRASHPEVDWDVIEGMRHVLVLGYFKIRPKQLWNTILNDIPKLRPYIESNLKNDSFI